MNPASPRRRGISPPAISGLGFFSSTAPLCRAGLVVVVQRGPLVISWLQSEPDMLAPLIPPSKEQLSTFGGHMCHVRLHAAQSAKHAPRAGMAAEHPRIADRPGAELGHRRCRNGGLIRWHDAGDFFDSYPDVPGTVQGPPAHHLLRLLRIDRRPARPAARPPVRRAPSAASAATGREDAARSPRGAR